MASAVEKPSPVIEPLLALSRADSWEEASKEWEVSYVEYGVGGCACGKQNITKICHIKNMRTQATTTVGSKCVEQVGGIQFETIASIMEASLRILHSRIAIASPALIHYAFSRAIFSRDERDAYIRRADQETGGRILRDRALIEANRKLRLTLGAQAEFPKLVQDPHLIVEPVLVRYAMWKGVLSKANADFYNRFRLQEITTPRRAFLDRMNQKMLDELPTFFGVRRGEKRSRESREPGAAASASAAAAADGLAEESPSKRGRET